MITVITVIATTPDGTPGVADAIAYALDNPQNYPDDVDTSDWDVFVQGSDSTEGEDDETPEEYDHSRAKEDARNAWQHDPPEGV